MGITDELTSRFPAFETIDQLAEGLLSVGAVNTDRLFSLCPQREGCLDALIDGERYYFYPKTADDDTSYEIAIDSDIPVLKRANEFAGSNYLSAVKVPRGAKSLSRLLFAFQAEEGITLGDLFEDLGCLLSEAYQKTGRVPEALSLDHVAYYSQEDKLILVPPLNLVVDDGISGLQDSLRDELDEKNHSLDTATAMRRFKGGLAA